MTVLEEIQSEIAPELEQLNALIDRELRSSNELMATVIAEYLRKKGKQIRPILVILTAKLFGEVSQKTIAAAASVEMLHNASLIHDDVIDESKMRRGLPTINSVWDNHIAVLIGDYFVSTSLGIAADTGDWRLVSSLARLGRMLSTGELDQIYNARRHHLDEASYFKVIYRKTASLFVTCVEMGASTAGAPADKIDAVRKVGELLGLCFQIRDDIFDYLSDKQKIGKPTGNDLREGKVTLPLLYALTRTDHPLHEEMNALVRREELTTAEIDRLISFAIEAGGIDYAYATMKRLCDEAEATLATLPESDARNAFGSIMRYIIDRSH